MDVMKAQSGVGLQTLSGVEGREQAEQNAVASLQARYGEKPKEARVIKMACKHISELPGKYLEELEKIQEKLIEIQSPNMVVTKDNDNN